MHERRVRAIAWALFDLTAPSHHLGPYWRHLLGLAALLHDVGRGVRARKHPHRGARMILRDTTMPLWASQRRALAFLTRYHSGPVPDYGYEKFIRGEDDRDALRTLLALLRAADALDSRDLAPPVLRFSLRPGRIRVICWLHDDRRKARALFRRGKKLRMLEQLLDRRFRFRVRTTVRSVHA